MMIEMIKKFSSIFKLHHGDKLIDLNKSQWWSLDQLEEFQDQRLISITKYAYDHIPAYRKKLEAAKVKPRDIRSKDDLWKLPIIARLDIQNNDDFVSKKRISGTLYSGGSTGSTLKYYESAKSGKIRWNAHLRGWSWNGYVPGNKLAVISSAQGLVKNENTIHLTGELTNENLRDNVEQLIEFKPQHLRGYVSSLYILGKYCLENDIKLDGIISIDPISENLYDFQKEIMEKAFDCKVFEEYCCNDGGACAWECNAHEGLHYCMERAIIEDIDGEMVVTDLWNKAMPFIRYKNGDSVQFINKKCSCGRELPLIKVKGRDNDVIITKNGVISPTFLIFHTMGGYWYKNKEYSYKSGIRDIQFIQKHDSILEVNIVKNPHCKDQEIKDLETKLSEIAFGLEMKFNFVEDIPTTKKGKRAFIINEDEELLRKWKNGEINSIA